MTRFVAWCQEWGAKKFASPLWQPLRGWKSERLESAAATWKEQGKASVALWKYEYPVVRAYLWVNSTGGKNEEYSEDLADFVNASFQALGDDQYSKFLAQREYCLGCGQSYRIENLCICTNCYRLYCYGCVGSRPGAGKSSNGNVQCLCGGEFVG